MVSHMRRYAYGGAACLTLAAAMTVSAQKDDKTSGKDEEARRPKLTLKAQPMVSSSPARIVLTAELTGGARDFEEYYCPTVEWEWGDGTKSQSTLDCPPYEAGKSEIKRRFTVQHIFRAGSYRVNFRLKRQDKQMASASVSVQVQPGLRDDF